MIDEAIGERLYARLRRPPIPHTVPGSLPVLAFGNLFTAHIATIGLNPSDQEYVGTDGHELVGAKRRFETLSSLRASSRTELTDEQCAQAIETMRRYFQTGKPVYTWFISLDKLTRAMGFAYNAGEVAHLDLVQEATKPKWSELWRDFRIEAAWVHASDEPFLLWQLETFPLQAIICNGRTVWEGMMRLLHGQIVDEGLYVAEGQRSGRKWFVGQARVGDRTMCLIGWNISLAQAPGLRDDGLARFGTLLLGEARRHGLLQ